MINVRRREFIALVGGAAAWPLVARAQQPQRMRRVGLLMPSSESNSETQRRLSVFRQALAALGWTEGRNVRFDHRWAVGEPARIQAARELIGMNLDVVIAASTPVVAALQRESRTTPIVFTQVGDPIGSGFAAIPTAGFPAPIGPEPGPMPPQDRGRLNDPDQTEHARPQPGHPHQQCAITAPQPETWRSSPQGDVELMTEKEVLGFKSEPRLEQIGDIRSKEVDDRKHRTG